MKRVFSAVMFILLVTSLLTLAFHIQPVRASGTAIYLEPSTIEANPLESFTVALNIDNVTDLHDWQAQLIWDPQILDFVDATEGDFPNFTGTFSKTIHQTEGWALMVFLANDVVSGSGTLANIVFRGIEGGECTLSLNRSQLFDSNPELVSTPPNLGDVNNDSKVDMKDTGLAAKAFGTSVGDPRYNPNADFNADGFVDLFDLLCAAINFGRLYPPYPEPSQAYRPVEIPHSVSSASVHIMGIHDITVDDVTPTKTVVGAGYSISINTTVTNEVYFPETFNVTLYANETSIALQNVTLTAGASITLRFTWNTTGFAKGNYTISAYAEPVPKETNLADNNLTCPVLVHVGVPGDISGPTVGFYDSTTNMRDIQYLILLFNTNPSSPNWKPNADINNDATVNMRDIQIAILNFNKHE